MGELDQAISSLGQALAFFDERRPADLRNIAFLLNERSLLRRRAGQPLLALEDAERAVSLQGHSGLADRAASVYHLNAGLAAYDLQRYELATKRFRESANIAEALSPAGTPERALALQNLASAELVLGEFDLAEVHLREAEALLPEGHSAALSRVQLLHLSARVHLARNSTDEARLALQMAAVAGEELLNEGKILALEHRVLNARLALQEGRFTTAEAILLEVEAGASHADLHDVSLIKASALYNRAEIEFLRGRYAEAEVVNQAAESRYRAILGGGHHVVAQIVHRRAIIHQEIGDLETALALYAAASEIFDQTLGPSHPFSLLSVSEKSRALSKLGRHSEAAAALREVLDHSSLQPVPSYERLLALTALGLALKEAGQVQEAVKVLEEALSLRKDGFFPIIDEPPGLNALAELYLVTGHLEKAKAAAQRSADILLALSDTSVDRLGEARRVMAEAELILGGEEASGDLVRMNMANAQERLLELGRLSTYTAQFTPVSLRRQVKQALELHSRRDDRTEMFRAAQLLHLHESTLAANGIVSRLQSGKGQLAELLRRRQQIWEELKSTTEVVKGTDGERSSTVDQDSYAAIQNLQAEKVRIDEKLSKLNPQLFAELSPSVVTVEEVQAALGQQEALWMQATFDDASFLFLITRDSLEVERVIAGQDELAELVSRLRTTLDMSSRTAPPPFEYAAAHQLYKILFGSFSSTLEEVERIIAVPDSAAQQVSLAVLTQSGSEPSEDTNGAQVAEDFLGLSHALSTIPSPTTFVRRRYLAHEIGSGSKFIGIGNPTLSGPDGPGPRGASSAVDRVSGLGRPEAISTLFVPLEETALELELMSSVVASSERDLFFGADATEANVKALDFSQADTVVFATHAVVSGEFGHKNEPALVLTPPASASQLDDGLLTVSEISQLQVPASIVLLSACNTAAPSGRPGAPGLSGLAAGFFRAGAQTLVVSHWPVASVPTVFLTSKFYHYLKASFLPPSKALRRSMLDLFHEPGAAEYSHPAFWAPFSVIGDS